MKIDKEPSPSGQDVGTSSKEEKENKIEDKQESSTSIKKAQEQESSSSAASSSSEDENGNDEEEEDDDQASCSSSDDSEEIKQLVKYVNKLLKKINSKGVPTTIEQLVSYNQRKKNKKKEYLGCGEKEHYIEYCPLMKARRKQKKKERKASKKAFTSIAKGGFDMTSSSDEEIHHKPRTFLPLSSSFHICLMVKETYDDLIARENDELKQKVTRLTKGLDKAKRKEKL
ncbi:NKAP family protein CG6066-like [Panicum hallii]|uniref:NKAP family protein CG6066-like n=1 Tax=Panicum hallii TaxID=206008 RepID=UPI000DF4E5F8|nr:NKAP family protein CG6066-like [Panicum hallii]